MCGDSAAFAISGTDSPLSRDQLFKLKWVKFLTPILDFTLLVLSVLLLMYGTPGPDPANVYITTIGVIFFLVISLAADMVLLCYFTHGQAYKLSKCSIIFWVTAHCILEFVIIWQLILLRSSGVPPLGLIRRKRQTDPFEYTSRGNTDLSYLLFWFGAICWFLRLVFIYFMSSLCYVFSNDPRLNNLPEQQQQQWQQQPQYMDPNAAAIGMQQQPPGPGAPAPYTPAYPQSLAGQIPAQGHPA